MGIAGIFRTPPDRLKAAIVNAVKPRPDRERAINELRAAITRDAQAAADAGARDVVAEAHRVLATLQLQNSQADQAVQTLADLRRFAFGAPLTVELGLRAVADASISESALLAVAGWLAEAGRLGEASAVLRSALDERFPRSASLAACLGEALMANREYPEAVQRYHAAVDLRPDEGPRLIPRLQAVLDAAPQNQLAQQTLGAIFFRQRDYAQAGEHLATALLLGDLDVSSLFALADAYLELRRPDDLLTVLERLLDKSANEAELIRRCERASDRSEDRAGDSYRRMQRVWGDALRRQSRFDEALTRYRLALDGLPGDEAGRALAASLVDRLLEVTLRIDPSAAADAHLQLARAYLLAGVPERALAAYKTAVEAESGAVPQAITGLREVIAAVPALLPARLELAALQTGAGDWTGARDTLAAIRRDLPAARAMTIEPYRSLLAALAREGADGELAAGPEGPVLSDTLYALAEELAGPQPAGAVAHLARLLTAFGVAQADGVLAQLQKLGLYAAQPLTAHLVEGDAHLAKQDLAGALAAYGRVPLDGLSVDPVCERLERLAEADAHRSDALLVAAMARLDTGSPAKAMLPLRRAFERDRDGTAPVVIVRLDGLRQAGECPPAGLALLADALIHLGDDESLPLAVEVTRMLLEAEPARASEVAARGRAAQQKAGHGSATYAQAALLVGEALAVAGQSGEAALAYGEAIGQPQVDAERLIGLLEALCAQASGLASVWLTLGDARRGRKADVAALLDAYAHALQAEPEEAAEAVAERVEALKLKGKDGLPARLLRAEALAQVRPAVASEELHSILADYGERAIEGIIGLVGQLPAAPATWFLRAEVEATRGVPEEAASWLERVVAQGEESDARRAAQVLRMLAEDFPASPAPRLGLARALRRLGRIDEATRELGDVAAAFPAARAQAMAILDELGQVRPTPAVWLNRARGFAAEGNVPAALQALAAAIADETTLPEAHDLLLALEERHPGRPEILQAEVQTEALLRNKQAASQAVGHIEQWLKGAPAQAAQIVEAAARLTETLEVLHLESTPLALRTRLVWADALLGARQPVPAAGQLGTILAAWPKESRQVTERCNEWLAGAESLDMRLVLIDAYVARHEFAKAVEATWDLPYTDGAACRALAGRCQEIVEASRTEEPKQAAQAATVLAEWLARQGDAQEATEAARTAVRLDAAQVEPVAHWLGQRGWDEASRRMLLYAGAGILREAGEPTFERALGVYRTILGLDLAAEAPAVLDALDSFPSEYLPARQMALETCARLGPPYYERAFALMRAMLSTFGPEQAGPLLALCEGMGADQPGVHLMRAEIEEATGRLPEAAAALLGLQAALPAEFPRVEQALLGLLRRRAERHDLRLALGDAYRQAEQWDAAVAAYGQAQEADAELAPLVLDRYAGVLAEVPEHIGARWGLATAHRALAQPDQAAGYVDELSDLDAGQAPQAEAFLAGLIRGYAKCGRAWYVRGKLAYRAGEQEQAIAYLERALQKGEIPPASRAILHEMLGRGYYSKGELDPARDSLRQAVALSPDDPRLRQMLLEVRLELLDRAVAAKEAELATGADPLRTRLELADLLQQRGQYGRATAVLQAALATNKRQSAIHLALARCFAGQQLYHLSAASLEAALATDELSGEERKEMLYRLAQARRQQLRFEEAIAALEQVCALDATYQNVLGLIDAIQREKVTAQRQAVALRPLSNAGIGDR